MNYSNYQDEKSDNEMDSKYYNIGRFRKGYKHIVFYSFRAETLGW